MKHSLIPLILISCEQASSTTTWQASSTGVAAPSHNDFVSLASLRGGSSDGTKRRTKKTKKSSRKKRASSKADSSEKEGRQAINVAMREKDAAAAMGDAIRERSDILLQDELKSKYPTHHVDPALASLSYALGISTTYSSAKSSNLPETDYHDESGGVTPPTSAVIANYFLKSHGGTHGIQSLFSLLSTLFGMSALIIPSAFSNIRWEIRIRLVHRCLLCALTKHLSSFFAVATMSATRIPEVGWRDTRKKLESLALDPVAQYLFYCALLLLWVGGVTGSQNINTGVTIPVVTKPNGLKKEITVSLAPWFLRQKKGFLSTACILGPILLREAVSTLWVLSDVLVLIQSTKSPTMPYHTLTVGRSVVDAIMSILLTPSTWRNADAATRQKLLATLVGRTSLALEVGTGLILVYDACCAFLAFSISSVEERPPWLNLVRRVVCARLYINFMWVRKKKIRTLLNQIRGGAMHVPGRVFDTLLEPGKAMGIEGEEEDYRGSTRCKAPGGKHSNSWVDWSQLLLGFK